MGECDCECERGEREATGEDDTKVLDLSSVVDEDIHTHAQYSMSLPTHTLASLAASRCDSRCSCTYEADTLWWLLLREDGETYDDAVRISVEPPLYKGLFLRISTVTCEGVVVLVLDEEDDDETRVLV